MKTAELIIKANINWIIINDKDGNIHSVMPISELAKYLATDLVMDSEKSQEGGSILDLTRDLTLDLTSEERVEDKRVEGSDQEKTENIDLLQMPAKRLSLSPISLQSNLMQAHELFESGAELLFVVFREKRVDANSRIYGVITRKAVERAYIPAAT